MDSFSDRIPDSSWILLLLLTKDVTVDFVPTFISFNFLSFAQTNFDLLDLIGFFTDRKF